MELYRIQCHQHSHLLAAVSSFCVRDVDCLLVTKGSKASEVVFTFAERWKEERGRGRDEAVLAEKRSIH